MIYQKVSCAIMKHGRYNTKLYKRWNSMRQRCYNPKHKSYKYYGGKGVFMSKEWQEFQAFYKDMGDPPSQMHSIDRINTAGPYSKENCRWATQTEQMRNHSNTKLTVKNVTKIKEMIKSGKYYGRELAKKFKCTDSTISMIKHGHNWRDV